MVRTWTRSFFLRCFFLFILYRPSLSFSFSLSLFCRNRSGQTNLRRSDFVTDGGRVLDVISTLLICSGSCCIPICARAVAHSGRGLLLDDRRNYGLFELLSETLVYTQNMYSLHRFFDKIFSVHNKIYTVPNYTYSKRINIQAFSLSKSRGISMIFLHTIQLFV